MSYIRCLSNPESLYIWSEGHRVAICEAAKDVWFIPQHIFDNIITRYHTTYQIETGIRYKGCELKEVQIIHKKQPKKKDILFKLFGPRRDFKLRLSYKGHHVDMWDVTWEYVAMHDYHHLVYRAAVKREKGKKK